MQRKHRVQINVADRNGTNRTVLRSTRVRLPERILRFLFGDFCEVLVLTPGESVEQIEIHEVTKGGGDAEE